MTSPPDLAAAGDGSPVTVAVVQSAPVLGDLPANLATTVAMIETAAADGARLIVFPECALTGYVLDEAEARAIAQPVPGAASRTLVAAAVQHGVTAVVGLLTLDRDRIYNAALVARPDGSVLEYRKAHLPRLGVDRYCAHGDLPFTAIETPVGSIGVLICYDLRFPEAARAVTLAGADLLVVLANWPREATDYPDVLTRARAGENRLPLVVASRVGTERGVSFLGQSQAVLPDGAVIARADGEREQVLMVRLAADQLRATRLLVTRPEGSGGLLADRRPDLYRGLAEPRRVHQIGERDGLDE